MQYGKMVFQMLLFCTVLLFLSGCGTKEAPPSASVTTPDFFGIGDELAEQLIKNRRRYLGKGEKLVFTSIVNLDTLHSTSKFGRTLSESLATSLFRYGYGLEEIRKISGILIRDDFGEIILSRDAKRLAKEHNCDVIVAGTYALTPSTVIINVKFLDTMSKEVLSVAGLELQRTHTINYLLASEGTGQVDARLSAYELR